MKNLIIIGAGGMGRSLYNMAINSIGYGDEYQIKGFLDDDTTKMDGFKNYPPIVGTISDYAPKENDIFICSLGTIAAKMKCTNHLKEKGAVFTTLIHKTARVSLNVEIGEGSILAPNCYVDCDTKIGKHCLIQADSIIAHDCFIGDWTRFDCKAMCVGGVHIGNRVTIHTAAILSHNVIIGDDATVGACSFVCRKVKEGTTVAGNPAREILFPKA